MNTLVTEIRDLIRNARRAVVQSVDLIQVLTNYEIGRRIVEHEQQGAERAEYGEAILKALAAALTDEFGRGFSLTNLKLMRQFYLTYCKRIGQTPSDLLPLLQKSQTLSDQLQKSGTASRKSTNWLPCCSRTPPTRPSSRRRGLASFSMTIRLGFRSVM